MASPAPEPIKIQFRPGIDRETTNYGNTGGWYDCNLARVKSGTWNSIGGWRKFTSEPAVGIFRSLFPWSTLDGNRYYATGTNVKYYIVQGNSLVDITPIRRTVALGNDPFETDAAASTTITVTDVGHGATAGGYVTFSGATGPIDDIPADEFNAEHVIVTVPTADTYTIAVTTPATAGGVSGGGAAVSAAYQLNIGLNTATFGDGWGTGGWGDGGWGEGSGSFAETAQLRLWTEDNFGEDLLFNVRNGGVYFKDMSSISSRGVNLTTLSATGNIPTIARQIMVSDNDRHVIAFGANTIGTSVQDRLLARWSTSEDASQWTPDTVNTAGSLRFDGGSEFVKAVETTTEILVFTDTTLHSMRFIGPPFTFGQTRIGTNVQLIGPNAVVSNGAQTFWMDNGVFRMYDGVVRDIPCSVRTYIFGILNNAQAEKIVAGINRTFGEVWWHLPTGDSSEVNFYVIYNYNEQVWYYGSFNGYGRTSWIDAWFETTPLAGAVDGYIYSHELGATDGSTSPSSLLESYLRSSVFEIGNGGDFMYVSRLIPDMDFDGSTATSPTVTYTFEKRDYPGSAFATGPEGDVTRTVAMPVEQYTAKVDRRFRTRSAVFGIEATTKGTLWQLGVPRLYASPDGRR